MWMKIQAADEVITLCANENFTGPIVTIPMPSQTTDGEGGLHIVLPPEHVAALREGMELLDPSRSEVERIANMMFGRDRNTNRPNQRGSI